MTNIDRTKAPEIGTVNELSFPSVAVSTLSNGIEVHEIKSGSQKVVQINVIFEMSRDFAKNPLVAKLTNELIGETTKNYKSGALNEAIDFYGAYLETTYSVDHSSISLFCLESKLDDVLPLFIEAVVNTCFNEDDVKVYLKRSESRFKVNQEKVSFLTSRAYSKALYGDHYYGNFTEIEHFSETDASNLQDFYDKYYTSNNCKIIVSGNYSEAIVSKLNPFAEKMKEGKEGILDTQVVPSVRQEIFIEKEGAIQSGVRVGRILPFEFGSTTYFKFKVLNTLLGGYFGSRLMSNIREDKGYTYGIGSSLSKMKNACVFSISTEVGSHVTDATLKEIYFELERLQNEPVAQSELETVKNYMKGLLLRSTDGVFSMASQYKAVNFYNRDLSYFNAFLKAIDKTTVEDIRELAMGYLSANDLIEVAVGQKS